MLRRVLADMLHLQLDDLRLRGQMYELEPPAVRKAVDGEGAGDEPGDGNGVEPIHHAHGLENGEVAALPGQRRRDAGHRYSSPRMCQAHPRKTG